MAGSRVVQRAEYYDTLSEKTVQRAAFLGTASGARVHSVAFLGMRAAGRARAGTEENLSGRAAQKTVQRAAFLGAWQTRSRAAALSEDVDTQPKQDKLPASPCYHARNGERSVRADGEP